MKKETLFETIGNIDDDLVEQAAHAGRRPLRKRWKLWCAAAACVCLVGVGATLALPTGGISSAPNPPAVQVTNPLLEVSSAEEMERYLDFPVPVLNKETARYIVLVQDGHAVLGQVDYADGSCYRIGYGSEDVSGIYSAQTVDTREVAGVSVEYRELDDVRFAVWQQDGYSCSYTFGENGDADLPALIESFG